MYILSLSQFHSCQKESDKVHADITDKDLGRPE